MVGERLKALRERMLRPEYPGQALVLEHHNQADKDVAYLLDVADAAAALHEFLWNELATVDPGREYNDQGYGSMMTFEEMNKLEDFHDALREALGVPINSKDVTE